MLLTDRLHNMYSRFTSAKHSHVNFPLMMPATCYCCLSQVLALTNLFGLAGQG